MAELKKELIKHSLHLVDERITNANKQLSELEQALFNETKSSAGDKFETSRAMVQAEQDRIRGQLSKAKELRGQILNLDLSSKERASTGSLVVTDKSNYFIAVGLGKVKINETTYYVISPLSPIGQLIIGKSLNDTIEFNGTIQKIIHIT